VRTSDERELVRSTGRWAWRHPVTREVCSTPAGLGAALGEAVAA